MIMVRLTMNKEGPSLLTGPMERNGTIDLLSFFCQSPLQSWTLKPGLLIGKKPITYLC